MPTISQRYDIKSLIEHYANIQVVGEAIVKNVREYHSNCPWCGGKDRFITRPETGQYSCAIRASGCGRSGDAIDFLMEYCQMERWEAVQDLGLEDVSFYDDKPVIQQNSNDQAPPRKWHEAALLIVERAERYLWHPNSVEGQQALAYLRSRGLTDETIKHAHLGYVPLAKDGKWYVGSFEDWGLNIEELTDVQRERGGVRVPDGILIPWLVGGSLWKLAVKRPGQSPDYGQVVGSVDALYNVDAIQYDQPAMLVEGEIDCLSVQQEAFDLIACVATGSSAKGRAGRWIADLSLASIVLQSFDNDHAGDEGADYWLSVLKHAKRWTTGFANDPNEMLQNSNAGHGMSVRQWVQQGLNMFLKHEPTSIEELILEPHLCSTCLDSGIETPVPDDHEFQDFMYCDAHMPHPDKPLQGNTQSDQLERFASTVAQISDIFGGCQTQKHDGSSLANYMRMHMPVTPYSPSTLEKLPRRHCPHIELSSRRVSDTMWRAGQSQCSGKPLQNGWCEYHQPSQQILEIGALNHYPEMNCGHRFIGSGIANWEGYAETVSPGHLKEDLQRVQAHFAS